MYAREVPIAVADRIIASSRREHARRAIDRWISWTRGEREVCEIRFLHGNYGASIRDAMSRFDGRGTSSFGSFFSQIDVRSTLLRSDSDIPPWNLSATENGFTSIRARYVPRGALNCAEIARGGLMLH